AVRDVQRPLVDVHRRRPRAGEPTVGQVRLRDELQELERHGGGPCRALRRGWHDRVERNLLTLTQTFIAEEEERAVLAVQPGTEPDRRTEGEAKLVALEGRNGQAGIVKEVLRVQLLVPEKLERFAVELVRAGARRDVDDGAAVAPVFGAESGIVRL